MKKLVSMRAALGDDDLLGKALKGESWSAWRTMLIAAMGEPLLDDERQVFAELTGGREREPGEPVEEFHAVVGRRSGKTKAAATAAVYLAALCDHSGQLAAGERAVLPLLSATTWQASRAFNLIRGVFMGAPALAGLIEGETAGELRLRNAVDILCRPASFRTIRGATAIGFVADEVGFWYSAEQARNPDTEIFNAMRPALATLGGPLLVVSSPYARRGELWNAFKRDYGFDGDPKIVVINASSRRMNPTLSEAIVARAYERDQQAAASEFGGEFRTDISGFLDFALVDAAVDRGVLVRPPQPNIDYRSACDPSGGAHDSFTLAICHDDGETAVLDCLVEARSPFNPTSVVADMAATLAAYRLTSTTGDKYASGWVPDAFAKVGVKYEPSERTRSQGYLDALPLFTAGRVRLIDNGRMVAQFAALERRTTAVGRDMVDHGPGGRDDCCNAAALALSGRASGYLSDMSWVRGDDPLPPQFANLPYFARLQGMFR